MKCEKCNGTGKVGLRKRVNGFKPRVFIATYNANIHGGTATVVAPNLREAKRLLLECLEKEIDIYKGCPISKLNEGKDDIELEEVSRTIGVEIIHSGDD